MVHAFTWITIDYVEAKVVCEVFMCWISCHVYWKADGNLIKLEFTITIAKLGMKKNIAQNFRLVYHWGVHLANYTILV